MRKEILWPFLFLLIAAHYQFVRINKYLCSSFYVFLIGFVLMESFLLTRGLVKIDLTTELLYAGILLAVAIMMMMLSQLISNSNHKKRPQLN